MLNKIWNRQFFVVLVGTVAFLCLVTAFIAQYIFYIMPCHLCLYERYIYAALTLLGFVSLFRFSYRLFSLTGLIIFMGLGLALYHLGVEWQWWQASHACKAPLLSAGNFNDFQAQFMKKPVARCDQINWVIFGLSATIWNVILFLSGTLYLIGVKIKGPR